MQSIGLWHKQYISSADSDSTSDKSIILLTLNTIETALRLKDEDPSISLIDDILLSPFIFKHTHSEDITSSQILSSVNRYKLSFEFLVSIQNKTERLNEVFTTFEQYTSQTKAKSISCILRDINSLNILLLHKNYRSTDYILYESQPRMQCKLNGSHFLIFQNQNLLFQYVESIFCVTDASIEYIADFIHYKSNNTHLISKHIDYNLFKKDLSTIGIKTQTNENIVLDKEQQELIDLYDSNHELWRTKIRGIIRANSDQFQNRLANVSLEFTQAFSSLGLNDILVQYIVKDITEFDNDSNDNNVKKIKHNQLKATQILRWINNKKRSNDPTIIKDENWLYDKLKQTQFKDMDTDQNMQLDRSEFHAFFELYGADDTFVNICDAIFDNIDANKDGTVSLIEWFNWQHKFNKNDLHKLFNKTNSEINQLQNENKIKLETKSNYKDDMNYINASAQQLYDQYIKQYGYAPKEASHLMHFSKKNGSKLMFVDCKNVIIANKENNHKKETETKKEDNYKPHKINQRPKEDNSGFFERTDVVKMDQDEKDNKPLKINKRPCDDNSGYFERPVIKDKMTKMMDEFNFEIFQSKEIHCNHSELNIIRHCSALNRICAALKYDNMLCKIISTVNMRKELFITFNVEQYLNFLNDFIHVIKQHGNSDHLLQINNELRQKYGFETCDISLCNKFIQHFRRELDEDEEKKEDNDIKYSFYSEYYNNLHFFFFHLFDTALRSKPMPVTESNDTDCRNFVRIDNAFVNKRDKIKEIKENYAKDIETFDADKMNKYNIKVTNDSENIDVDDVDIIDITFLDKIYQYLQDSSVDEKDFIQFSQYIEENEYDTEAIKEDVNTLESNIIVDMTKNLKLKQNIAELVKQYIKYNKLSSRSLSTGFEWNYWHNSGFMSLINASLFVFPSYGSLKEEIMSSGFVTVEQWNEKVSFKAQTLLDTQHAKKMKIDNNQLSRIHGLSFGDAISVSHLESLILYCDFSALCTDFSGTFRKNNIFEPLESTKKRNSKYYYFSKLLAESVQDFGICGTPFNDESITESGPFYCGINCVLNIPVFAITFAGPSSTSKQIQISMNFAKKAGMIIQLQNDGSGRFEHFFDCSWISNYIEEDERLFMLGKCNTALRIESIRLVDSGKNYELFFHAFYLFDAMVSGIKLDPNFIITKTDITILKKLINSKVTGNESKIRFESYVVDAFDLYCMKKENIMITFRWVEKYFLKLSHLLFTDIVNYASKNDDLKTDDTNDEHGSHNLLKPEIFKIFPNIKTVFVRTTTAGYPIHKGEYPTYVYSFSMCAFLSVIELGNPSIKYVVQAHRQKDDSNPLLDVMIGAMFGTPKEIETKIAHYKIASVKAMNDGNMAAVRQYLLEIKELTQLLLLVRNELEGATWLENIDSSISNEWDISKGTHQGMNTTKFDVVQIKK